MKEMRQWFRWVGMVGGMIIVLPQLQASAPPPIQSLLRSALWKRVVEDKEVLVNASLRSVPKSETKKYSFYAVMRVSSGVSQVRRVLTQYSLYKEIIPYVDRADYFPTSHTLQIEGGIWNYHLGSEILFDDAHDRWIQYRITSGHFVGLTGNIYFESLGEKGTVVYFSGTQIGNDWPPRFVIERGAEIVFRFTANRLRSYIESQKRVIKGVVHGQQKSGEISSVGFHIPNF